MERRPWDETPRTFRQSLKCKTKYKLQGNSVVVSISGSRPFSSEINPGIGIGSWNPVTQNLDFRQIFVEIAHILSILVKITEFLALSLHFSKPSNKSRCFMRNFDKIWVQNICFWKFPWFFYRVRENGASGFPGLEKVGITIYNLGIEKRPVLTPLQDTI
jgi:hypothetical protein